MGMMVITGASKGIGRALWDHYRMASGFEGCVGVSRSGPDHVEDMRDNPKEVWDRILQVAIEDTVVVLNAGIMLLPESEGRAGDLYDTNLWAPLGFLRLLERGQYPFVSSVILIGSVAGVIGDEEVPIYAAYKAAIINATRSYARILVDQKVRVNCISPGLFDTSLVVGDPPRELIDKIPMKRAADPNELIPVVDMLINCQYITGQNIIVDGGLSL